MLVARKLLLGIAIGTLLGACGGAPAGGENPTTDINSCVPSAACDDGNPCTNDDQCNAAGECSGDAVVCDDGNLCTDDSCEPTGTGCVFNPVDGIPSCDDDNLCTSDDRCENGKCTGDALPCDDDNGCTIDSCDTNDGCRFESISEQPCNDGDPCTVDTICNEGTCEGAQEKCTESPPCQEATCDAESGECGTQPMENGLSCAEESACSQEGNCEDGACVQAPVDCDDNNACTKDSCAPGSGCKHEALSNQPCSDDDACTEGDACDKGSCLSGTPLNCDDGLPCTVDSCDTATGDCLTTNQADDTPCPDDSACVVGSLCQAGVCVGATKNCDDSNACTNDSCDPLTGCVWTALDQQVCDDGNPCTIGDLCNQDTCQAGTPTTCANNNPCIVAICDTQTGECGESWESTQGATCDDGNPCTLEDLCQEGACESGANTCGCETDAECTDQEDGDLCNGTLVCNTDAFPYTCQVDPTTVVSCSPDNDSTCAVNTCKAADGSCDMSPLNEGLACDDGDKCTGGDTCQAGQCESGDPVDCDDQNPCTDDSCNPSQGCVHENNAAPCDADNSLCTPNDYCDAGICQKDAAKTCPPGSTCSVNQCQAETGNCTPQPINSGKACEDGDLCTSADTCASGVCQGGATVDCDDDNLCTTDSCDSNSGCSSVANTLPCDADGDPCTVNDVCTDETCVAGAPLACADDGNPCSVESCDSQSGECVSDTTAKEDQSCSDDDTLCNYSKCKEGTCTFYELTCPNDDGCADAYCDPSKGCKQSPNQAPCDDSDACTTGDVCDNWNCTSGSAVQCNDNNNCTTDSCDAGAGCQFEAINGCNSDDPVWTVLVYMAADNNLELSALKDLEEMLNVPSSDSLNIVVQLDRAEGYSDSGLGGLDNWETTKRLQIKKYQLTEISDLGETNSGDPDTLTDFIQWGLTTYPANRRVLLLWDHGNGWVGYGGDSSDADHDRLTLSEITSAIKAGLEQASVPSFELIGFDACLMADYALAQALAPHTRYLLASEDYEPGTGWDYRDFRAVAELPSLPVDELAKKLMAGFLAQSAEEKKDKSITLSLLDLDNLGALNTAFDNFTAALSNDLDAKLVAIGRGRDKVQEFGRSPVQAKHHQLVDLADLVVRIAAEDASLLNLKDDVLQAVDQVVLDQVTGKLTHAANGLSVYFPRHQKYYEDDFDTVPGSDAWRAMIKSYYDKALSDTAAPVFVKVEVDGDGEKKDVSESCGNQACNATTGENPFNCPGDCANNEPSDIPSCTDISDPRLCAGDYLLECFPWFLDPVYCGEGMTCGQPYGDPKAEDPADLTCILPPATAELQCLPGGVLQIDALLGDDSSDATAEQYLVFGYMNHADQSIQLYGRKPATLDTDVGAISGSWDQRVLTLTQGGYQSVLFARTTFDGKLAHHEIPLRYTSADEFPCKPGLCTTFDAVWHVTTDVILNSTVSQTLYVNSKEGLSELTLREGDKVEPMILSGTLGGEFFWKPIKALVLAPNKSLAFRYDILSNIVEYDATGAAVQAIDGTVSSLIDKLNYSRVYLELTADSPGGNGDRTYWLGEVEDCPPAEINWCTEEGEIPDCQGNCAPKNKLQNGTCDDGTYSVDFYCFRYRFDEGDCQPPPCPWDPNVNAQALTEIWVFANEMGLGMEAAEVNLDLNARDCDMQCLGADLFKKTMLSKDPGSCYGGQIPNMPNFNCRAFAWNNGGCKCAEDCSGHGECTGKQGESVHYLATNAWKCVCDEGWFGPRCDTPTTCGDGPCTEAHGEDCLTCELDCLACTTSCGDGVCQATVGENCDSCPYDCEVCACGDGQCTPGVETCSSCASDCGACPVCGDGVCAAWSPTAPFKMQKSSDSGEWMGFNEDCGNCPQDCGECDGCCCTSNDSPGCKDPTISECVCRYEPACCAGAWTVPCLAIAQVKCGFCTGGDFPPAAVCGDSICTGLPGDSTLDCDFDCKDVDYIDYDHDYDEIRVFDGLITCNGTDMLPCNDNCPYHYNPIQADLDWDKIGDACDSDQDGDGVPEGLGNDPCVGGATFAETGCDDNCPQVPNGGQLDADADGVGDACALAHCGDGVCSPAAANASSCCNKDNWAIPGCDDPVVEACICSHNADCCDVLWGVECMVIANTLCAAGCAENPMICSQDCCVKGTCCEPSGSQGCTDESTEQCVCQLKPECCSDRWDLSCSKLARESCGACTDKGECCDIHGTPGCADSTVETCVCGLDSDCCDKQWDGRCIAAYGGCGINQGLGICVDEALLVCTDQGLDESSVDGLCIDSVYQHCTQGALGSDKALGTCDGNLLTMCVDDVLTQTNCEADEKTCGLANCEQVDCGGFSPYHMCLGEEQTSCLPDCIGQFAGEPDGCGDECPTVGPCSSPGEFGCVGTTLTFCDGMNLFKTLCALAEKVCSHSTESQSYECMDSPCIPLCDGIPDGDDNGCGGQCGPCEPDCDFKMGGEPNGCGKACGAEDLGPCGDVDATGVCEGDTLKYCGANDKLQATTMGLCSGNQQLRYCDQGQLVVVENANKGACKGDIAMMCMMQNMMAMDCTELGLTCGPIPNDPMNNVGCI